jgi:hypothetical protein
VKLENPQTPSTFVRVVVFVSSGRESCEITSITFVVWSRLCTRGNETHCVLAGSSIVKTMEIIQDKPEAKHHLRVEKARGYLRSYLSEVLGPHVDFLLCRAPMRINKNFV